MFVIATRILYASSACICLCSDYIAAVICMTVNKIPLISKYSTEWNTIDECEASYQRTYFSPRKLNVS